MPFGVFAETEADTPEQAAADMQVEQQEADADIVQSDADPVITDQTLTTTLDKKVITVSGAFPEDAVLQAVEVPVETVGDVSEGSAVFAVDLSILSDGQEYQPEAFGDDVQVDIEDPKELDEDADVQIVHVKKSVYAIIIHYTVDYYFLDAEFHMEGGTSIALSELFKELAITKDVSEVETVDFTSPELISIEKDGKDWTLQSLKEFHSKELLTVTFDDESMIEIGVMDKFSGAEGTCGTCTWTIDADLNFTLKPTDGSSGTLDDLSAAADAPWNDYRNKIASITVENGVKTGEKAAYMFSGCTNLSSVDLSGLDTSAATDLGYMFSGCSTVKSIDVSSLDTTNLQKINHFFNGCSNLTSADLSGLDLSNVTNVTYMFQNCTDLKTAKIKINGTASSTAYMFNGCTALKDLDVSDWDVSNITSMAYMFQNCSSLTDLDVSGWNPGSVASMTYMFSGCAALKELDVSNWDVGNVTSMAYMFNGCTVLDGIDVSGWSTAKLTNMSYMFQNCKGLTSIDLSGLNLEKVTTMLYMFSGCTKLASADVSGLKLTAATDIRYLFNGCSKLTDVDISNFSAPKVAANCTYLFQNCTSLESIDLSTFSTPAATSYGYMFNGCSKLKDVTFNGEGATFNPVKVANMNYMFQNCTSLESIDLNNLNTAATTNMAYMFSGCSSLTSIDISGASSKFKAAKAANMSYMFNGCSSLTELDLTPLTLNAVTNTSYMFQNCSGLEKLQMTITKAGNSLNAQYMLSNCKALTDVDLQILQTGTSANLSYLLNGCSALEKVDLTKINTANVTTMAAPLRNCLNINEITLGGTFKFLNTNTGLIDGYWDQKETGETEEIATTELATMSMNGEADGTYVLMNSKYTVILYEDGELVFTKGGTPEEGRTVVDTYAIPNGSSVPGWNEHATSIKKATFKDEIIPSGTYYWFNGCSNLTELENLENLNMSEATTMTYMFTNCTSLQELDLTMLDTPNVTTMNYMFDGCTGLTKLTLSGDDSSFDTSNVAGMAYMFRNCSKLTELDLSGFNTEAATNMTYMFSGCAALTDLDISKFNTGNATNMSYMFNGCAELESLDLPETFTGAKATTLAYMFAGCTKLADLDMSNFATSTALTNMSYMFQNCTALTAADLSKFETSKVTNFAYLFSGCTALADVDVSSFNTAAATSMQYMFNNCSSLTTLDVNNFNAAAATNMSYMFAGCTSLEEITCDALKAPKVTNASYMFNSCSSLKELDLSNFNTGTAAAGTLTNIQNFVSGCKAMEYLNIGNMNTLKVTTCTSGLNAANLKKITIGDNFKLSTGNNGLPYVYWVEENTPGAEHILSTALTTTGGIAGTYVYDGEAICAFLYDEGELVIQGTEDPEPGRNVVKKYNIPNGVNTPAWYSEREQIEKVTFKEDIKEAKPMAGYQWFYGCSNLKELVGTENLNTSAMTSMYNMFNGCSSLESVDVSDWDTANVTNMQGMFQGCTSLKEADVSSFITAKVTNMSYMFHSCREIKSIKLGNLNTANLTTMAYMFYDCPAMKEIDGLDKLETNKVTTMLRTFEGCNALTSLHDIENWDVSSLTTLQETFAYCEAQESLDLTNWDISKVTTLYGTFYDCKKMTELDVSTWDTSKVTSLYYAFAYCEELPKLDVSNFDTANVTDMRGIFYRCNALESIDVTTWDTSKATSMAYMFAYCRQFPSLDVSNFDFKNVTSIYEMFAYLDAAETIKLPEDTDASKITNCAYLCFHCSSLKEMDMSGMKFGEGILTTANSLFSLCEDMVKVDISTLDITNGQFFGDFFHDCTSLQEIKIGEGFRYKQSTTGVENQLSNGFPSGIWLYDGDGQQYKATDIVKLLETGSMPGTFTKVKDHSIQANFPAQYKIGKIFKIDDLQIERKRNPSSADIEFNDDWQETGTIWMKVEGDKLDDKDWNVPIKLTLTFKNVVEDAFGNKFDLQMEYDNIKLYDAKEIYYSNGKLTYTTYYHNFFRISKNGNIAIRGEDRNVMYDNGDPAISPNAFYDITLTIIDPNKKRAAGAVEGNFIFSIYDLDIASLIDLARREAGDLETTTPSVERNDAAYGLYSEGVYLKDGFDLSTLTMPDNTYLNVLGTSSDGKWEGFRIQGTQIDSSSELTDVVIKADASGSTFTWSGWSCEDFLLYKYQPEPVYFHKVDQFGNRIDGAKLKLFKLEDSDGNKIDPPLEMAEWVTDSSKNADYSAFLEPGKYLLKEVETPQDYETSEDVTFIIDIDYDVCDENGNKIDGLYDEDHNRIAEMNIVSMTDKAEETEATVKKVWNDKDDQDGIRPVSLTVDLSNGKEVVDTVTLNDDNDWTATVKPLPKQINGKKITYTWIEKDLPKGYKLTDTSTSGTITTLTNSHTPDKTEIKGTKVWYDGGDSDRPDKIVLHIIGTAEGDTVVDKNVTVILKGTPGKDEVKATLKDDKTWEYTIKGLDKNYKGTEIAYDITEVEVNGYVSEISGDAEEGFTIHNWKKINIPVEKKWFDGDSTENRQEITVVLKADGEEVDQMVLNSENSWKGVFKNLMKCDAEGNVIKYTVDEVEVDGYITKVSGSADKGFEITNTLKTEATVKKVWDDADNLEGIRPDSLTVTLNDGTEVTLNEDNEWTATVEDLPMYDADGEEIEYTWTEKGLPEGYELTETYVDGTVTTLTNTLVTEATIIKVWDDADDQDGIRPETLTVALSDGTEVTLGEDNDWSAMVEGMPKYDADGAEIEYTWTEKDLPEGYELTDTSVDGTITTLTNSHTPANPPDKDKDKGSKTGDDTNLWLSIILMTLCGLLATGTVVYRRRRS